MNCPHCARIIYNRRLAICEWCLKELPPGMSMSKEERAALDQEALRQGETRRLARRAAELDAMEAKVDRLRRAL